MNYSLNPTSKLHYFGHMGGYDGMVQFQVREDFPLYCPGTHKECHEKILNPSSSILSEIMTDATFESKDKKRIKKPHLLFEDKLELFEDCLFDGNYKWLRYVRRHYIFLPNMKRSYPLSYLQATPVPRKMNWHLTKPQDGVLLGGFGTTSTFSISIDKHVSDLLLGLLKKE